MNIKQLPWRLIRKVFYEYRKMLYTVPVPDTEGILVQYNIDDLYTVFRENHFDYQELSYNYYNEDYNLARAEHNHLAENTDWQLHVRMFRVSKNTTYLLSHFEHDPSEAPKNHLDEDGMSWAVGTSMTKEILDDKAIKYTIEKASNVVDLS